MNGATANAPDPAPTTARGEPTDGETAPQPALPFVLPSSDPPPENAKGLGTLSRTIRRRTSDLIAIGILVVGGIAFANRLSRWNDDPVATVFAPTETAELPWNEPGRPVTLEFGNADFVLHRELIEGSTEFAMRRLVERTADLAERTPLPTTPPDEAEQRLIASASKLEASRKGEPGTWSVHVSLVPMPAAIGLRVASEGTPTADGTDRAVDGPRRAVCWGMLLGGQDRWTAFWFQRRSRNGSPTGDSLVAIPGGAERTVTILDARGVGVAGFHGRADVTTWREFFDRTYEGRRGCRTSGEWTRWGHVWTARFAFDDGRSVDVRIADEQGTLDGLLTIETQNAN